MESEGGESEGDNTQEEIEGIYSCYIHRYDILYTHCSVIDDTVERETANEGTYLVTIYNNACINIL